jgi:hypothetical protein
VSIFGGTGIERKMAEETKSKAELQNEREALELEVLRDDVARKRSDKAQRADARMDQERALREGAVKTANLQRSCNHKKGGRDYASTQKRGDGDNFCVIPWVDPLGRQLELCTRCLFLWEPGVTAKFMKDGKTPNPTGISWQDAIKFPTDNSPASSVLFGHRPAQVIPEAA